MSQSAPGTTPYYYVPQPSRHPALASFGLFFVILGAGQWINGVEWTAVKFLQNYTNLKKESNHGKTI